MHAMTSSVKRYVYIMGRGHSGSTVLDALLGNADNARGVGELVMGIDGTYPCSCGKEVEDCSFWSEVRRKYETEVADEMSWEEAAHHIADRANVLQYLPVLTARRSAKWVRQLQKSIRNVVDSVSQASGYPIIVDSSKEISRGLFLSLYFPDARIVHIVRDPVRMLASDLHRLRDGTGLVLFRRTFQSQTFAPLIIAASAFSWVVGNLLCETVAQIAPEKVMRVRYEDLCRDPDAELSRIARFTGLQLDSVIKSVQRNETLSIDHKLAGNRMAKKGEFVFQPGRSQGREISPGIRRIGRMITYPLAKRYGYE
jgi:hypothetical protein